jgi:thioesterase domain-containing protein
MRLRLLDRVQADGRGWPDWVPALCVRHIYLAAKALYEPQALQSGRVVVMRAEEGGDPDDPDMYLLKDSTLGWGRVVAGKLDAMDVRGGHSTMLQEPHVEYLAKQISDLLAESST